MTTFHDEGNLHIFDLLEADKDRPVEVTTLVVEIQKWFAVTSLWSPSSKI